jgi:hypothetical protein
LKGGDRVNGQNTSLPTWTGPMLKIGGVILAAVLAFTTLQGQVKALDTEVERQEDAIKEHDKQIHEFREVQIVVVTTLEQIQKTQEETIKLIKDLHDR